MTQPVPDGPPSGGGRLWWALRFYRRLLGAVAFLLLLVTVLAVGRTALAPPTYTATATILGTQLEVSPERLPRFAEAIFQQDSVLAEALEIGQLPWTVDSLRDDHSRVTPLEDNVLINVDGEARDPLLSVRTANAVADALTTALNGAGTDIGRFTVQERPSRAVQNEVAVPAVITTLAGLIGTVACVLGLAGLLLAVRRPVTRPGEAIAVSQVALLTILDAPGRRPSQLAPGGFDALRRGLFSHGVQIAVMTAPAGGDAVRTLVAEGFAQDLSESRDVTYVPAEQRTAVAAAGFSGTGVTVHGRGNPLPPGAGAVVVDGFDDESATWRESLPPQARAVVIAPEGVSQEDLQTVMDRFVPEDVAGLIYVRRQSARRRGRPSAPPPPSPRADSSRTALSPASGRHTDAPAIASGRPATSGPPDGADATPP